MTSAHPTPSIFAAKKAAITTPKKQRRRITEHEINCAMQALDAFSDENGVTPCQRPGNDTFSACGVLRYMMGVDARRSSALLGRVVHDGLVERIGHSEKVRIVAKKPAEPKSLEERAFDALILLRDENEALRSKVATLRAAPTIIVVHQGVPRLKRLIEEIESEER